MILFLLSYLGGVLTILSPCILPVLPFVFARADQPFVALRPAAAGGHGGDFRRGRDPGDAGRQLGGACQSIWPHRRHGAAGAVRPDPACRRQLADRLTRPLVALGNRLSNQPRTAARRRRRFAAAGRGDRTVVGALRRADPGPDPDRRGDQGRQRQHHLAAAGLCRGRGDLAGGGAADRRARLRRHEEIAGRGRMDPPRAGRAGAGGRGRHRAGPGHRLSDPAVAGQHRGPRTGAAGKLRPRPRHAKRRRRRQQPAGGRHDAGTERRGGMAEFAAADPRAACAARWCWWISGPIPASTACGRCLTSKPGRRNTRITAWW